MLIALILAYIGVVALVLMFLTGAKRLSYTSTELAAEDDLQYAWLKAELANKAKRQRSKESCERR